MIGMSKDLINKAFSNNYRGENLSPKDYVKLITKGIESGIYNQGEALDLIRTAYSHELTGLRGKKLLGHQIEDTINKRKAKGFSVLFADLDNFKPFNDKYSHDAGDVVLKQVGEAMAKACRESDGFVHHIQGDEFVVILPNTDERGAERVRERIEYAINRRKDAFLQMMGKNPDSETLELLEEKGLTIEDLEDDLNNAGISIGKYTTHVGDDIPTDKIVGMADKNMYKIKKEKKNGR